MAFGLFRVRPFKEGDEKRLEYITQNGIMSMASHGLSQFRRAAVSGQIFPDHMEWLYVLRGREYTAGSVWRAFWVRSVTTAPFLSRYRGTWLIRNQPPLGPYPKRMPRIPLGWWFQLGEDVSC